MAASDPIRSQIRDLRLQLSQLNQLIGNGQQSAAATNIASAISILQAIQVTINASDNVTITTK